MLLPWCCLAGSAVQYVAFARHAPRGLRSLLASLPLLICLTALPFVHEKATVRGSLAFVTTWLSSFKVLAAAVGRGPLAQRNTTAAQHAALLLLPLNPAGGGTNASFEQSRVSSQARPETAAAAAAAERRAKPASGQPAVRHVLLKLAAASGVILLLQAASEMPAAARHVLYAVIVWLTVSLLVDVPSALLGPALGLQLSPCMRQPYRAAGLGEFWGRRYNLVVSSTLRYSVFEPLMQALRCHNSKVKDDAPSTGDAGSCGCSNKVEDKPAGDHNAAGSAACGVGKTQRHACSSSQRCRRCWVARAVATTAAFAVSGLMHELCVWHMCQTSYVAAGTFLPGRHLLFFLLQAPLLLLECHVLKPPAASSTAAAAAMGPGHRLQKVGIQPALRVRLTRSWQGVQRTVVTFAVLAILAEVLFWPPFEVCKSDLNGVAEIADGLAWLQRALAHTFTLAIQPT